MHERCAPPRMHSTRRLGTPHPSAPPRITKNVRTAGRGTTTTSTLPNTPAGTSRCTSCTPGGNTKGSRRKVPNKAESRPSRSACSARSSASVSSRRTPRGRTATTPGAGGPTRGSAPWARWSPPNYDAACPSTTTANPNSIRRLSMNQSQTKTRSTTPPRSTARYPRTYVSSAGRTSHHGSAHGSHATLGTTSTSSPTGVPAGWTLKPWTTRRAV